MSDETPGAADVPASTDPEPPATQPPPAAAEAVVPAPPPAARPSPGAGLRRAFAERAPDALIVVALLFLFWVVHRNFEEVEFGGDAVEKWQFARQWSYANAFDKWSHHKTRMGVNALSWLVQKLFGSSWRSYPIGPFFMAALQVPFIYATARKLAGRWAGVLGVLLITYMPMVHRSASQVLPDGYAGTYGIIGAYLFFRWVDAPERTGRLIAIGVCGFLGYLAKETFVFFYPGFVVAIWLERRRVRDLAIFLGTMLAGLLCETAAYAIFTPYNSRYAAIHAVHGADDVWPQVTFWDLFKHFHELHDGSKYLMFFAFAAALWLLAFPREHYSHGRGLALIGLSQIFFVTFGVRGINPITIWQQFDPRYMDPSTPFMGALAGTYLAATLGVGWQALTRRLAEPWLAYGPSGGAWFQSAWATLLIGLVALLTHRAQKAQPPLNAFVRGQEIARLANDTYERNLPLVESGGRAKVLTAIYDVYLDDRRLARDGILPDFADVSGRQGKFTYLLKDPKAYRKGTLGKLMDEGCYMELDNGPARNPGTRDRRSSIEIKHPADLLPARCDELLAELNRR